MKQLSLEVNNITDEVVLLSSRTAASRSKVFASGSSIALLPKHNISAYVNYGKGVEMYISMLKIVYCLVDVSVVRIRAIISQLSISFRLMRIQLCVAKSIRYMNADQVKIGAIGVFSSAVS